MDWIRLTEREPARGQRVLLFFPKQMRRDQVAMREDMMLAIWPPAYPRKPTMWAPTPELPKGEPAVDYYTQETVTKES